MVHKTDRLLSILIPVFNEARTILLLLEKVKEVELIQGLQKEIVIVNDSSSDNTEQEILNFIANNPTVTVQYIKHQKNQGKGAALHTAISVAKGEYLVIQDADLEYDPQDYNALLLPVLENKADVVYGSRFVNGKSYKELFALQAFGNRVLTKYSNFCTNLVLTDMETCYKLFKKEVLFDLKLKEKRFGFEPEITAKIARKASVRIIEVGISYYGRTYGEGKKIGWRDGVRALYCITKYGLLGR